MVYLQLSQPYRNFDKVKISFISISESDPSKVDASRISFKYQIFRFNNKGEIESLFERNINLTDKDVVSLIGSKKYPYLNLYDTACRALLEFLLQNGNETGTIEIIEG